MRTWTAVLLLLAAAPAAAQEGKGGNAGDGPGAVVVVNRLERDVSVWINGERKGSVEPGDEVQFDGVPAGRVDVQAGVMGSGGPVASEERALAPGETFTWTLYPLLSFDEEKGTGTVVVKNGLEQPVDVFLGENPAGTLAPGASRAYARVVAGEVRAVARNPEGEMLGERKLEIAPGGLARWEIGSQPEKKAQPGRGA
ncbi:MAG: hypothetical protein ABR599_06980 [Gemmatimonadota bacterium]